MPHQPLNGPRRRVPEGADGMAFNPFGDVDQHVDLLQLRIACDEALHHPPHPAGALAARRALAAAFMLVEVRQPLDGADHVGRFVHDDDRRGAESALHIAQAVEIHQDIVADAFRQQRHRAAARNDGEQVVPTAAYAAGMLLNQLTQRTTPPLFHVAGLADMARDAEKFRARVIGTAKAREPARATAEDLRPDGNALDVVDCRGAAPDADVGREWRLQARLALVALKAFNERGFLTADIGARAAVHVDVDIIARAAGVFADQPGVIGLLKGFVEVTRFQHKLTADVDIGSNRAHRETGDKTPLQQAVR